MEVHRGRSNNLHATGRILLHLQLMEEKLRSQSLPTTYRVMGTVGCVQHIKHAPDERNSDSLPVAIEKRRRYAMLVMHRWQSRYFTNDENLYIEPTM